MMEDVNYRLILDEYLCQSSTELKLGQRFNIYNDNYHKHIAWWCGGLHRHLTARWFHIWILAWAFLSGVRVFSLYTCGFCLHTLVSSQHTC